MHQVSYRYALSRRALPTLAVVLIVLLAFYWPMLLTQPAGGDNPYMDDVGEMQVALNIWGTIHHTGYPLFTILGNLVVAALRALGVGPAAAPSLYSLMWGLAGLAAFFLLVLRLTGRASVAAAVTLLLGLARSVWVHNVIPEVYSMSLTLIILLLLVALWGPADARNVRQCIWLLALIGGFGVAHHRIVAFMAPGLLLAVWPGLRGLKSLRRALLTLAAAVPIALVGFLPYLYLPARALAGAAWVYGNPGTLAGFWHEFSGAEAAFLLQLPADAPALFGDVINTFRIIGEELTPPLALAGGAALLWALFGGRFRREARIAALCALGYAAFLFIFHRAVMPEAVSTPIIVMLVLGLALALDALAARGAQFAAVFPAGVALAGLALLAGAHYDLVHRLTHDPVGVEAIAMARRVPRDEGSAVLMLPWGARHTAVAFSKYVTGENADLRLVPHTADFGALAAEGTIIYTSRDTFYRFPLAWWDAQIGRAYLSSPAEEVVAIRTEPLTAGEGVPRARLAHGIVLLEVTACIGGSRAHLDVRWLAERQPDADLSIFVHLLGDDSPVPIAQADSSAPVYGWYPTTRWSAGEVVREHYALPVLPGSEQVALGMYAQPTPGQFVNYPALTLTLASMARCE